MSITSYDPIPFEAIGKILTEVMDQACANGADSRSMPDEYVEVAYFLCYHEKFCNQAVEEI